MRASRWQSRGGCASLETALEAEPRFTRGLYRGPGQTRDRFDLVFAFACATFRRFRCGSGSRVDDVESCVPDLQTVIGFGTAAGLTIWLGPGDYGYSGWQSPSWE